MLFFFKFYQRIKNFPKTKYYNINKEERKETKAETTTSNFFFLIRKSY